ncbi:Histone deacetylase 8 [Podochytrium sp. JEL0797]|nr:Histone deacetylase 8 [Podochytrium sp. JEL0797]
MVLDAFRLGDRMTDIKRRSDSIIPPKRATIEELTQFHSHEFVEALLTSETKHTSESTDDLDYLEEFGLLQLRVAFGFDCPVFPGLAEYTRLIAGGALAAVNALTTKTCQVAIHWDGGRHHAHQDKASGFCYVNDIVLGVMAFHDAGYRNVLYIDLDVHHGDGVESAFLHTSKVFRLSFHIHSPGFFPGTGAPSPTSPLEPRTRVRNVAVPQGTDSSTFLSTFTHHLAEVMQTYPANAVVMQCGLDGCQGDPLVRDGWKLDAFAIGECVSVLLDRVGGDVPVLLLGGGGYDSRKCARGWTYATARVVEWAMGAGRKSVEEWREVEIPEHEEVGEYGPWYLLYE